MTIFCQDQRKERAQGAFWGCCFFKKSVYVCVSGGGGQRVKVRRGWERGRGNLRAHPSICCGRIMDICYNKWAGWFYPNIRLAIIFPVLRKLKRWNPESEIQSFNNLCFVFNRRVLGENSH